MKTKKLEKLELKKHTISSLSETEMNAVAGGEASSPACAWVSAITAVTALSVMSYHEAHEQSWAFCPDLPYTQNPSDNTITEMDGTKACLLNEVVCVGTPRP